MNASSLRSYFAVQVKLHVKAAGNEQDLPYASVMQHVLCYRSSAHDTENATMVIRLNRSFSYTLIFIVTYVMHTEVKMLKGRRRI
jgi:hypothetical protein